MAFVPFYAIVSCFLGVGVAVPSEGDEKQDLLALAKKIAIRGGKATFDKDGGGAFAIVDFSDGEPNISDLRLAARLGRVKKLSVAGKNIGDDGLQCLQEFVGLEWLIIDCPRLSNKGLAHVTKVQELRQLVIRGLFLQPEGIHKLSQCKKLESLDASFVPTLVRTLELPDAMDVNKLVAKRVFWRVAGTRSASIDGESFRGIAALPKLKSLGLAGQPVDDKCLLQISRSPTLAEMDLSATNISDKGLKGLANNMTLTHLKCDSTDISDQAMEVIVSLRRLQAFSMADTRIGNQQLKRILTQLSLRKLSLSDSITDECADALSEHASLDYVDLADSQVTERCVAMIGRKRKTPITIQINNVITTAQIQKLSRASLHLRILDRYGKEWEKH